MSDNTVSKVGTGTVGTVSTVGVVKVKSPVYTHRHMLYEDISAIFGKFEGRTNKNNHGLIFEDVVITNGASNTIQIARVNDKIFELSISGFMHGMVIEIDGHSEYSVNECLAFNCRSSKAQLLLLHDDCFNSIDEDEVQVGNIINGILSFTGYDILFMLINKGVGRGRNKLYYKIDMNEETFLQLMSDSNYAGKVKEHIAIVRKDK